MSKKAHERSARRQRGAGGGSACSDVSPQKLNLVAGLIRGKKVASGARRSRVFAQAHRQGCAQVPGVGDRECREQPRPRRRLISSSPKRMSASAIVLKRSRRAVVAASAGS